MGCNNIWAPEITPLCLWSSCCSIVSFLCSVLYILFVLLSDFLSHCISVLLQFALMIIPLVTSKYSSDTWHNCKMLSIPQSNLPFEYHFNYSYYRTANQNNVSIVSYAYNGLVGWFCSRRNNTCIWNDII
jgi:hypothetical protein